MRIFLLLLVLLFSVQSWTRADDIRDFEIEGISIGDSLLDFYSKKEIKQNINLNYYKNKKYTSVEFYKDKNFKTYDGVEFNFLTNDNKYTIVAIAGLIFCSNNFSKCKNLEKKIDKDLSDQFVNLYKNSYEGSHNADKSGESKISHNLFEYENGDMIVIETINWSKKITKKKQWTDNISISLRTREFNKFLGIAFD